MYIGYCNTKIGLLKIEATDEYIRLISLVEEKKDYMKENDLIKECTKQLLEYFNGTRKHFDIPIKAEGTEFQEKVWNTLRKIPYGQTISYKELATLINNEKAVRAVGSANGKNPILIIIPCHRVINSNGNLGGFACGIEKKKELLKLELNNV